MRQNGEMVAATGGSSVPDEGVTPDEASVPEVATFRRPSIAGRSEGPERTAQDLRERLYASFTGLAIVIVVHSGTHVDAVHAFWALALGVLGITIAGTVSEMIAHLLVERTVVGHGELRALLRSAGGALSTVLIPLGVLWAAWLGWLEVDTALRIVAWVYTVILMAVGWLAVRRSTMSWPKRILVLAVLTSFGLVVVIIQALAKSV